MKTNPTWNENSQWNALLSYLPADFRELAVEHKQLETQYGNAKVTTADDLLRFIFLHVGPNLPLRQTVALAVEGGGPKLSPMRLHMKMRKAAPYLRALVRSVAAGAGAASAELWCGYEMISCDASAVSGPGSEGTDARLHTAVRLSDLSFKQVEVTDVSGGETLRRFDWEAGELAIVDRGYANAPGIAWVIDHGADVLVRVNRGSLPLFDRDGTRIDVLQRLRALRVDSPCEWTVQIDHVEKRKHRIIQGRLIAVRLPEQKAAEARQRVRREYGSDTTAEQLEGASFVALFTTTPRNRLSTKRCLHAYQLRWQIELQFKRWKSLCDFDHLPNYRGDTILAWLYAKVLLGLLMDRMATSAKEVFPLNTSRDAMATADPVLPPCTRPLARQPWKITSILWPAIIAALLPLALPDLISRLPAIADRLDALDVTTSTNEPPRPRQIPNFRANLPPAAITTRQGSC